MRRTARVVVVGLALSGFSGPAVPQALAAGSTSIGLGSHVNTVHTSTGKTLKLSITAFKSTEQGSTQKATVGVNLSTGTPYSKGETHGWTFQVARSDFDYTASSGQGSVNATFGPYGSVDLTFSKTSQSTSKCAVSGTMTTVKGTLHGSVHFDTNTRAWGSVNDRSFTFDTPNVINVENSCNSGETGGTPTCFTATTWSAPPATGGSAYAYANGFSSRSGGKTTTTITGQRFGVKLAHPSGATRTDNLVASAPAPVVNGNTLTVKTSSSGPVSGSAKIAGGSPQAGPGYACTINGQKKTEHTKSYYAANAWSSPNGIRFNFKASADLVTTKTGASSWSQDTYS